MDLFTYLLAKKNKNSLLHGDLFSYLLGKGQSQTYTVSGTTIYIPDAKKLVSFMINKESTQDGEPSPESPVEVKTVKGYRNLFDKDNANIVTNAFINQVGYDFQYYVDSSRNIYRTFTMPIQPNVAYTISKIVTSRFAVATSETIPTNGMTFSKGIQQNDATSITITSGTNDNYLTIWFMRTDLDTTITEQEVINSMMIVEGTEEHPYVPYGSNYIDVKVVEKNLLNIANYFVRETRTNVEIDIKSGYVKATDDRTYANKMVWFNIPVTNNQSYKISYINNTFTRIQYIYTDIPFETWDELNAVSRADIPSNNILTPTTKYITFVFIMSNAVVEASISNLMLENGLVTTDFEEYKETIVPIPLNNNEIVGIGDYKDELIVDKSGHVYLNKLIGKVVFNGSENWQVGANGINSYSCSIAGMKTSVNNMTNPIYVMSNLFKGISFDDRTTAGNNICYADISAYIGLYIRNTEYTSLNNFKNMLNTINMEVIYVLTTPDPIDLNTTVDLSLFIGVNNVSNSEDGYMTIEYY